MVEECELFECQQCGYCCHGETTVSLDSNDVERMVRYLKLHKQEVVDKYWRITGKVIQMKTIDGHCIFFENGCTIHSGKPWRCSQWPLHPSILNDESNFEAIKESCPGISRTLSYEHFCEKFSQFISENKK